MLHRQGGCPGNRGGCEGRGVDPRFGRGWGQGCLHGGGPGERVRRFVSGGDRRPDPRV